MIVEEVFRSNLQLVGQASCMLHFVTAYFYANCASTSIMPTYRPHNITKSCAKGRSPPSHSRWFLVGALLDHSPWTRSIACVLYCRERLPVASKTGAKCSI